VREINIADKAIGQGRPCFVVAEMSANHNGSYERAVEILHAAKECGADAVKLQTYTADTITLKSTEKHFQIEGGPWSGQTLYELYEEASTPWEWQPALKKEAERIGLILFSSPFDTKAVDFLARMDVPAYKIASFELVDLGLIQYVAKKGKPVIMSTGMASLAEIEEAVREVKDAGNENIVLLRCVSAYPASSEDMNLVTIRHLESLFDCAVGLSDHTLGDEVAIAAATLGARMIEKHFTLSRRDDGPDTAFSMEPSEFENMVRKIRLVEKAIGKVSYELTEEEQRNRKLRRSLFVVEDMKRGETFSSENVKSLRPAAGLKPNLLKEVLGSVAAMDIEAGTPLKWEHVLRAKKIISDGSREGDEL